MIGIVNGVLTLVLLILFLGICAWAWSSRNKETFDKMAHLPLDDDTEIAETNNDEQ